jgi:DNA-binding transcriptional regulator GbsR (MarR family)
LESTPLSQKEISEATGYSVPTVSKALNTLSSLGSVRRTRKPQARTALYYVEMHPVEMLSGGLARWILVAEMMRRRVAEIQRKVEEARGEDPQRAERLAKRLGELASFLPRMIEVMARAVEEVRRLTAS